MKLYCQVLPDCLVTPIITIKCYVFFSHSTFTDIYSTCCLCLCSSILILSDFLYCHCFFVRVMQFVAVLNETLACWEYFKELCGQLWKGWVSCLNSWIVTHSGLCAFKSLTPQILVHFFQQFQQNAARVETAVLFSISMRQKSPTIGRIRAQITGRARWGQRSKVNERSILCTEVNLSPLHRESHLEFRQIGLRVDLE